MVEVVEVEEEEEDGDEELPEVLRDSIKEESA